MSKLVRNRVTERDIRDWLQENGYEGGSAVLENVELHAIKRPGWKQLFRFAGKIRRQSTDLEEVPPKLPVWGIVLDDERKPNGQRTQVILCESEESQIQQLDELSADMLTATSAADRAVSMPALLTMAFVFVVVFFLIAWVRSLSE